MLSQQEFSQQIELAFPSSLGSTRRRFLAMSSAWAVFLASHGWVAGAEGGGAAGEETGDPTARLRWLRLATEAPLSEMRAFYGETLGFPLLRETAGEVAFQTGATRLRFESASKKAGPEGGGPFYHFAFNIPENKLRAAREWQLRRGPLLVAPAHLRDPEMPEDVVHFRHWNAHSVFFWDPAGNLVEYIARHDLDNGSDGPFGVSDIECASEIGLATDDVPALSADLARSFGVAPYRPGNDQFQAMGDEHGLLLVVRQGREWGWDSARARPAEVYPTGVGLRCALRAPFDPKNSPFEISAEGSRSATGKKLS